MNNENNLILTLCKFRDYDKLNILKQMELCENYPYVLGQLLYNRVGGIAYYILSECELLQKLNREFRNTLKSIYQLNLKKTESFYSCLNEIAVMFNRQNFSHAWLKGSYLTEIYPKGLRTSNDFDILIKPENIGDAQAILKENGFQQGNIRNDRFVKATRKDIISSRMTRGETVPYIKKVDLPYMGFMEIDINFSLDYKPNSELTIIDKMLSETETNKISTLSKEDFLIHLCIHLFKEATTYAWVEMGRDQSLYKYVDIYLFITDLMNNNFSKKLAKAIIQYEVQCECYYALYYTKKLFGLQNDNLNELLEAIKPNNMIYLKQIYSPTDKITYKYDVDFIEWIFCSNRKNLLKPLT